MADTLGDPVLVALVIVNIILVTVLIGIPPEKFSVLYLILTGFFFYFFDCPDQFELRN